MSLAPPTSLGPYEIVARIGEGGMGEVYRATDRNLKRSVAIKVLPAAMASDTDRLARFQREAEVLAALDHPNVAHIYGLEKTHDITALVMELVEGEDLSAIIARGPIALADALPIAKQIADALEAAHEHGIIHRDLKPANIKVRADGTVKVLDFGLAKAMDPVGALSSDAASSPTITSPAMTATGVILGTAAYMSPEQARGKAVDKRADIWAFARQTETDGVYIGSLDETGATRIVAGFTEARYSDGMLLFVRDTTLMAQPFDPMRRVLGPADPIVVSSVADGENEGSKAFSVSDGGMLVALPVAVSLKTQLKWFDLTGRSIADLGVAGSRKDPRISRDGLRVMMSSWEDAGSNPARGSLWTADVKTGRSQRLTFVEGNYLSAVWLPDASSVVFGLETRATGIYNLFRQPTNGNASQEPLIVDRVHKFPQDVSLDGHYLLFLRSPTQSTLELWILSLADRKASLYVRNGGKARLAPGGGWAAYAGNESGHFEIYLQSFPTPGTRFQISNGGGDMPVWSRDGREIFYQAGGKLLAAPVSMIAGTPVIGQARTLFDRPGLVEYDVSPDGRFLFAVPLENQSTTALVTLNWKAALKN